MISPHPGERRQRRIGLGIRAAQILVLFLVVFIGISVQGQQAPDPKKKQTPAGAGMATGPAHAAVKDSRSRPITAGGFVDGAPVAFVDITKQAGIDKFLHRSGSPSNKTILETMGSGVALLDYDNDGWLDIFLLNGSTAAAM